MSGNDGTSPAPSGGPPVDYREMIESVNSVVLKWNTEQRIEFINAFGAQLLGFEPGELVGQPLLGTIVADTESSGRSLEAMLGDIVEHPERYINNENENLRKDGTPLWLSWSNHAIYHDDGSLKSILSVGNDITAIKQAQAEQERLNRQLRRALEANDMLLRETEDLNHRLSVMARTDQLTGLLNRRSLADRLAEEFFRARRYDYPLGFLMLDIDHFKQVNDDFGHDVGDMALKAVAGILTGGVRQGDTAARFGGEEMCVVLPYASRASCWSFGERLRRMIEEETTKLHKQEQLPRTITVSVGGASTETGAADEEELLKQADEMLYRSKDMGRNRVYVHGFELGEDDDE
jgi:diguanylate cyclase (GGDEF)-like protein/PAS domain S-box-containing protein